MHADAPSRDDSCLVLEEDSTSRAVLVVQLLSAVLEDSPSNRQSMVQISGRAHQLICREGCMPRPARLVHACATPASDACKSPNRGAVVL